VPARIACLSVALFPLAARLRCEPELTHEALVIVEGSGNAARVLAATRLARRAGVRPGLTLPQARALTPKLVARPRDEECEQAAQEALIEVAESFSPRVEDAGEGTVYLDLAGLERHYSPRARRKRSAPSAGPEGQRGMTGAAPGTAAAQAMAAAQGTGTGAAQGKAAPPGMAAAQGMAAAGGIAAAQGSAVAQEMAPPPSAGEPPELELGRALLAASEAAGLPARVGVASSKLAARVAAALPNSPVIVPAGEEAAFLAPLPLVRLAPEIEIARTLERWGIQSIGDFARLPKARVASRLGQSGIDLHATARGIDPQPLMPRQPPLSFHEGMCLEWPLVALEPFLFVGRAALERLCGRLEARGLACARLELSLRLEPEGHATRSIALPAPTRDVKTLLTLVRLDLETRPPGAPVAGFTFAAHPDRPREAQLSLYGPAALSPDKLAATLARLFALLGPGRVGSPRPVDGHLPERFALVEYSPPPPPPVRRIPRPGHGLLAVRVLRPAVELEVIVAGTSAATGVAAAAGNSAAAGVAAAAGNSAATTAPDALRPLEVRPLASSEAARRLRIQGRVKVASGPWGLEDGWWLETPTRRDYWDVELTAGGIYRIYRDRSTNSWYADGVYD
jgi:nucleotidyltransferase/DNA polymerase involved in DNA repair